MVIVSAAEVEHEEQQQLVETVLTVEAAERRATRKTISARFATVATTKRLDSITGFGSNGRRKPGYAEQKHVVSD